MSSDQDFLGRLQQVSMYLVSEISYPGRTVVSINNKTQPIEVFKLHNDLLKNGYGVSTNCYDDITPNPCKMCGNQNTGFEDYKDVIDLDDPKTLNKKPMDIHIFKYKNDATWSIPKKNV